MHHVWCQSSIKILFCESVIFVVLLHLDYGSTARFGSRHAAGQRAMHQNVLMFTRYVFTMPDASSHARGINHCLIQLFQNMPYTQYLFVSKQLCLSCKSMIRNFVNDKQNIFLHDNNATNIEFLPIIEFRKSLILKP
jgi:hypothetical protein